MKKIAFGVLAAAALVACGTSPSEEALGTSGAAVTYSSPSSLGNVEFVSGSISQTGTTLAFQVSIKKNTYLNDFLTPNGQGNASIVVALGDACATERTLTPASTQHTNVQFVQTGNNGQGYYVWSDSIDVSACGGGSLVVTHHCSNGCAWDSCEQDGVASSVTTDLQLWVYNGPSNSKCKDSNGLDAACQIASGVQVGGSGGATEEWVGHWVGLTDGIATSSTTCGYANENSNDNRDCPGNNETSPSCEGIWP